jgi:hypothetical protein
MDAPLAGPSVRKPPWRWWKRLAEPLEAVSVRLDAWWASLHVPFQPLPDHRIAGFKAENLRARRVGDEV